MSTVAQAFQSMLQRLELTPAEAERATAQQIEMRGTLQRSLGDIDQAFLSGSYARNTAIRPLHDIDVFLVLNELKHGGARRQAPEALLQRLHGVLAKAYPKSSIKVQGRSTNIEFQSTGIGFDIVPAFASGPDEFLIPDRDRRTWLRTNPKAHATLSTQANERAGKKLKPLVKTAKQWNGQHGKPLASFHLEVMAYGAFNAPPASFPDGLRDLFDHLSRAVLRSCADPAGLGPNIDQGMPPGERQEIANRLADAARRAKLATDYEWQGATSNAHDLWRKLLGDVYVA